MKYIVIWLDDIRDPSDHSFFLKLNLSNGSCEACKDYNLFSDQPCNECSGTGVKNCSIIWAKNYDSFLKTFQDVQSNPDYVLWGVCFDNDLGEEKEGKDAFNWMEDFVHTNELPSFLLAAQTANPAARKYLTLGFQSLNTYWNNNPEFRS